MDIAGVRIVVQTNIGKVPSPGSDRFQNEKFRFTTIELKNGNSITSLVN